MSNPTTDLSLFGWLERQELIKILQAWQDSGLPDDFEQDEVIPMCNNNSGHVFLTNSEFQACMLTENGLKRWYNCRDCGHEGFAPDCILGEDGEGCNECIKH